jgi:hypothetical protein
MSRMAHLRCVLSLAFLSLERTNQPAAEHVHGIGHVHMDVSCTPSVSADFNRGLALLRREARGRGRRVPRLSRAQLPAVCIPATGPLS